MAEGTTSGANSPQMGAGVNASVETEAQEH